MFYSNEKDIILLIPTYNPNHLLIDLLNQLENIWNGPVILVNDGSNTDNRIKDIFLQTEQMGCIVCNHDVNRGKGRALKTGFEEAIKRFPNLIGVVTADGDGQHTPGDIVRCAEALRQNQDSLILGCRDFNADNVPGRSACGNKITKLFMRFLCGVNVSDTQTGLRGIPVSFMKQLRTVSGERYDFETNMLLETKRCDVPMKEIQIDTVYIDENQTSHFHAIRDSFRIYAILLKFCMSSLIGSGVDLIGFALFSIVAKWIGAGAYSILIATVMARVLSAMVNYLINRKVVFHSEEKLSHSATRYMILCIGQMLASAGIVTFFDTILPVPTIIIKVVTDTILFFFSFQIQRIWVFVATIVVTVMTFTYPVFASQYTGITIDGDVSDWEAVQKYDVNKDAVNQAAMVWDGERIYIYMMSDSPNWNSLSWSGPHSNGKFVITTDLGRTLLFQVNGDGSISGVDGAEIAVNSKQWNDGPYMWEISIPSSALPQYKDTISFGYYLGDVFLSDIANLQGSDTPEEDKSFNGITYDGSYEDWKNYPHTIIEYATSGTHEDVADAEGALYNDGTYLYAHVITKMSKHLQQGGEEFTTGVTIRANNDDSQCFYPEYVTVDAEGNITYNPKLKHLAQGTYEFYMIDRQGWKKAQNISEIEQYHNAIYGKMMVTIGPSSNEMEFQLDLAKLSAYLHCDVTDLKIMSSNFARIGNEWITIAGTSTGAVIGVLLCLIWVYVIWVLNRAKLKYWRFLVGSGGLFVGMMVFLRPLLTQPLASAIAALAGVIGKLTGTFESYFAYGIIFIQSLKGTITLQIDFECSGIIEIMAFLALLAFFQVYNVRDRIKIGIIGVVYIMLANALRILVICEMIHFFGTDVYYISHTIVGRIIFYGLSVLLYFYVFTKPHIVQMKIGKFAYGTH